MSAIQSHRDLDAWQRAMELSYELHRLTGTFPDSEKFGLISQLRRAGVSVPSNIAEGFGRGSRTDYARFLRIARGSLHEIDTQLLLARRLKLIPQEDFERIEQLQISCIQLVSGLLRSIERSERMPNAEPRMPSTRT